jgi:hypothetical protein
LFWSQKRIIERRHQTADPAAPLDRPDENRANQKLLKSLPKKER